MYNITSMLMSIGTDDGQGGAARCYTCIHVKINGVVFSSPALNLTGLSPMSEFVIKTYMLYLFPLTIIEKRMSKLTTNSSRRICLNWIVYIIFIESFTM